MTKLFSNNDDDYNNNNNNNCCTFSVCVYCLIPQCCGIKQYIQTEKLQKIGQI